MIPGEADIPDSIAKALLDALQTKRTGNNIPPAAILLSRIRTTQLKQCLLTGREPSDCTVEATLNLIPLEQKTSCSANLAGKVSRLSHILEYATDPPSTI